MRKLLSIPLFLSCIVGVLLCTNSIIYGGLALAFNINDPATQRILVYCLGFLSVSIILATIIGNFYYNYVTRAYYLVAAVWLGSSLYFFLASIVLGLIAFVAPVNVLHGVGPILFLLSTLISAYGVINARRIRVTRRSVTIPHLPAAWQGRTLLWASDIHLGQIHGAALSKRITRLSNRLTPDLVVIGGDLFDGTGAPDPRVQTAPLSKLIAPLGVFFITGNHEEYGDRARFLRTVASEQMRILDDEMVVLDGVEILGVDYHTASDRTRFEHILKRLRHDRTRPALLLKHEPRDLDIAEAAGISLHVSGHTHQAQLWPLRYLADRVYQGYAYGLRAYKTMQVLTSSGSGTWGPPMRVGTRAEVVFITFK